MSDEPSDKTDPRVQAALSFQRLSSEAYGGQRVREDAALAFQVPELQWSQEVRVQRAGQTVNGVPIPARPMLSIPSLSQPIQGVYNQWSRAHYGVQIHPRSQDANDETAEVFQGIYREIEVDSRAYIGRGWGFDRALKSGFGAYRVDCEYDEDTDDPDDQKVTIRRILRQSSVYWDPFSVEPDFCDQRRCLIVSFISRADALRQNPKNVKGQSSKLASMSGDELADLQSQMPNWARMVYGPDGSKKSESGQLKWFDSANDTVCIAEFFYTEWVEENMLIAYPHSKRKTRQVPKIKWCKINAVEVLEERDWDGKYIPIIPCIGNEQQPFDGERRWQGMIEPNMDSARLLNYEVSNAVETDALRPKAPFIGPVGTFKTNQAQWLAANVRNMPYLEYDPVMAGGQMAPPPQRNETSVDLSSSIALIQLAKDSIQTGTAVIDAASLEGLAKRKVAHQTLGAMADSNQTSQSQYLQNMADLSMTYEAKVILDLIPKKYDREGRIARIVGENGDRREVMLNAPFIVNPKTKRPMAVPPGSNAMGMPGQPAPKPKRYDLTKGTYTTVVSVGKSWPTRAAEGSDKLGELMQSMPEMGPALLPIWARFQDFPGHKEVETIAKKMQPPQLQESEEGEPEDAETLRTQRDQAMKIADEMKGQLQQAGQIIQTEQAKQQATLQKAQLDAQTDLQKAQITAETDIRKAEMQMATQLKIAAMKAQTDQQLEASKLAHADMDREDTQRFDHAEAMVDRAHELTLEQRKQAEAERVRQHASEQAERGQEHALEQGEQWHAQAVEMAEREPKPEPGE